MLHRRGGPRTPILQRRSESRVASCGFGRPL